MHLCAREQTFLRKRNWLGDLHIDEFATPLRLDREVVLTAIANDAAALQFASEDLRADREIVLAAFNNYGYALECASDDFRADRVVVLIAIANYA